MKKVILGVKIDDVSLKEAIGEVENWLGEDGKVGKIRGRTIFTPNPEMIVAAQDDPEFKAILNKADLSVPDGVGLKLAGIKNRVAGVDLMEALIQLAQVRSFSIGLLGAGEGVAVRLAERLKKQYPGLVVIPAQAGIQNKVDILFVAFGHGKQEKWIVENLDKAKVLMGVGGSFDYLVGDVLRAPKILRKIGLEWLFRLIIQPWRIKRQLALVKYLVLLLIHGNLFRN